MRNKNSDEMTPTLSNARSTSRRARVVVWALAIGVTMSFHEVWAAGSPPDHLACASQVYQALGRSQPVREWLADTVTPDRHFELRASLLNSSDHLSLFASPEATQLAKRTANGVEILSWASQDDCVAHLQLIHRRPVVKLGSKPRSKLPKMQQKDDAYTQWDFEDALDASADKKETGLIYVWSPNMNLSVQGFHEAERVAKDLKVQFVPLLDPNASAKEAGRVAKANHIPTMALRRMEIPSLYRRGMLDHYPSFIVFQNGQIAGLPRLGYDTPERLRAFIHIKPAIDEPSSAVRQPASTVAPVPPLPDDVKAICESPNGSIVKTVFVPNHFIPNYFHRALSKTNNVLFSDGWGTNDDQHHVVILNLETGQWQWGPGQFDLVPLLNEEVFTQPTPFRFYLASSVLAKGNVAPFATTGQGGYYQSTGILSINGAVTTHRILTDATHDGDNPGVVVRSYAITSPTHGPADIKYATDLQWACPRVSLKLPMLSKDGKSISGINSSGNTAIYSIGAKNNECTLVKNLQVATGKADFSYDGRYLTFHKSLSSDNSVVWNETPQSNWHQNIFVYEIQTGRIKQLTRNTSGNSTYPVFRDDGTVVYADTKAGTSGGSTHSFVIADPAKVPWGPSTADTDLSSCVAPCDKVKQQSTLYALSVLGGLWNAVCVGNGQLNSTSAQLTAMTLSGPECRTLVEKTWDQFKGSVAKQKSLGPNPSHAKLTDLDVQTLEAACPKVEAAPDQPVVVGQSNEVASSVTRILNSKCALCHTAGEHQLDFTNLQGLYASPSKINPQKSIAEEMVRRLDSATTPDQRMPLGGALEDEELKTILTALAAAKPN